MSTPAQEVHAIRMGMSVAECERLAAHAPACPRGGRRA
jgi:hypothetical protein